MQIRCSNCFHEYDEDYGLCPNCGFVEGEDYAEAYCLNPGTLIFDSRYLIGETLGFGGFGITYKAWDRQLDTMVAIKEYFPSGLVNRTVGDAGVFLVANKRAREFEYGKRRFLDEARNMAKFDKHHNIVNVFNYFEENNTAYIIMEYLDGLTLSQTMQMKNQPMETEQCISIAMDICDALASIHKENILHRDVSPDNIMLCKDGTVKLFDFGAARFSMEAAEESNVTVIVKPGFAPPEQYDKVNKQDAYTDIYALGATMYYALTGQKPEESTDRKIRDEQKAPAELIPDIPAYVSNAVMRAMAVEPRYRFQNAEDFQKVLRTKTSVVSVEKERQGRKLRRTIRIAAALAAIVSAAIAMMFMWDSNDSPSSLPSGEIEVWYALSGEAEMDEKEAASWQAIADYFVAEYENVAVSVRGISEKEYTEKLAQAQKNGDMPEIFESTGVPLSLLQETQSVEKLMKNERNLYASAMDDQMLQYPTGLVLPVIYVNTSIGPVRETKYIEKMVTACGDFGSVLMVNEDYAQMYEAAYGTDLTDYTEADALACFLEGECLMYLGTSADYLAVQDGMMRKGTGAYTVLFPETGNSVYSYGCLWSISRMDSDKSEISQAFLAYLNSNLAQDYFNIRNFMATGCVPATRTALQDYVQSYVELDGIVDYLELPYAQ